MELRHLRYFVAVAEHGTVSKAARKLFIAQPPLSQQLKQLEAEIGTPLFVRLPRGMQLTPAGECLLEDARAILARAQQAPLRAREHAHSSQTVVRVGLVPSAMQSLLPGLMHDAQLATGVMQWEAREMITSQQARAVREGQLELGIGRPDTAMEDLEVASIDDPYCLAIPQQHDLARAVGPLELQTAMHCPFVGFTRYQDTDYFDRSLAMCLDAGFMPQVRHQAGQLVNALSLVGCGLGVAIVPASFQLLQPPNVVFRPLTRSRYSSRLVVLAQPSTVAQQPLLASVVHAATVQLTTMGRQLQALMSAR